MKKEVVLIVIEIEVVIAVVMVTHSNRWTLARWTLDTQPRF